MKRFPCELRYGYFFSIEMNLSHCSGATRVNNHARWGRRPLLVSWLCLALLPGLRAAASDPESLTNDTRQAIAQLKKLSLEELFDQRVTTVSRVPQKLSQSPSAVQVLTAEEIHRSGATSLPEALRLASNLQVAQIDARSWAISSRGFNQPGGLSDKLLVMIDGRSVYTPLYAGVFWDVQNVLLEDIDHIEVVSGPGATLWGANAVNGVINVVTKSARDTQGSLLTASAGTFLQDAAAFRYGGTLDTNLFFRLYGQRLDHNATSFPDGRRGTNGWDNTQGGFRLDWEPTQNPNTLTFQGNAYSGTEESSPQNTPVDGQNVLGRWIHTFSEDSGFQLQSYFDRTWRNVPGLFAQELKTYDVDFQHRFPVGEGQNLIWGGGYRLQQDDVRNPPNGALAFLPASLSYQVFSGFIQDEIALVPDQLKFTLGSKFEHNDFSGFEVQPSGRLSWSPNEENTLWSAISRAVRAPSRIDRDFFIPGTSPYFLAGGPDFVSEKVVAYEVGYRLEPTRKLSFSLATFYNDYTDIRSVEQVSPGSATYVIKNGLEGYAWGAELSSLYQVTDSWRLKAGYTYLNETIRDQAGHTDLNRAGSEGNDPRNLVTLQSLWSLTQTVQLDVSARYVDSLPNPFIPDYVNVDVRLGWFPIPSLELSVVGQNLVGNHAEFGSLATRQEIPRSVYGKATWRF